APLPGAAPRLGRPLRATAGTAWLRGRYTSLRYGPRRDERLLLWARCSSTTLALALAVARHGRSYFTPRPLVAAMQDCRSRPDVGSCGRCYLLTIILTKALTNLSDCARNMQNQDLPGGHPLRFLCHLTIFVKESLRHSGRPS